MERIGVEGRGIPHAQEEEHARQGFLIPGEVLGGHGGLVQFEEAHGLAHPVVQVRRVHDGGVSFRHIYIDGGPIGPLDILGNGDNPRSDGIEHLVLKGPERPLHMGVI